MRIYANSSKKGIQITVYIMEKMGKLRESKEVMI